MGEVVQFPRRRITCSPAADEFGGCPECGAYTRMVNVNSWHWFVCDEHKTKWGGGQDVFPGWRDETIDIWKKNSVELSYYRSVCPVFPLDIPEGAA